VTDLTDLLDAFHYVEIRSRRLPRDGGVEWVVGLQAKRGGRVFRVTDTDLGKAVEEASRMATTCK
jgi:hypothetical protein